MIRPGSRRPVARRGRGARSGGWLLVEALAGMALVLVMAAAAAAAAAGLRRAQALQQALAEQQEAEALAWSRLRTLVADAAPGSVQGWSDARAGEGFSLRARPDRPDCLGHEGHRGARSAIALTGGTLRCAVAEHGEAAALVGDGERLRVAELTLRYAVDSGDGTLRLLPGAEVDDWSAVTRIELGVTLQRPPAPPVRSTLAFALPRRPAE